MNIASILGFGAIGLGFLLALLAYRLLATGQARERPVYIYMAFCLALLGVGAFLQYSDNRSLAAAQTALDTAKGENKRLADSMKAIVDALKPTSGPLQEVQSAVTGLACSGGGHGEAMNGGAAFGLKISGALSQISAAMNIAQQYVP
jgi:hypothetical protein